MGKQKLSKVEMPLSNLIQRGLCNSIGIPPSQFCCEQCPLDYKKDIDMADLMELVKALNVEILLK